ncbi:type VI secretion system tip protein VgrG, partial [Pseudomonas sp. PDM25]|nr:type VI secretion system tip protein VgrG [Pseudomonas sp. PDM25]
QAGTQAHVTATNVVIEADVSLTLEAGGQYIVITSGGIFSSVPIVQGGAPLAGVPPIAATAALNLMAGTDAVLRSTPISGVITSGINKLCGKQSNGACSRGDCTCEKS